MFQFNIRCLTIPYLYFVLSSWIQFSDVVAETRRFAGTSNQRIFHVFLHLRVTISKV